MLMSQDIEFKNNFRALDDDDVKIMQERIAKIDPQLLTDIYSKYSNCVHSLINTAKKQTDDETEIVEAERLKRLINLLPIDELFLRSKDKIWAVRQQIISKDSKYFLEKDYSALIKKDRNQTLIETIVEIIRVKYNSLSVENQNFYWKKANIMLSCVIKFKKMVGDYVN